MEESNNDGVDKSLKQVHNDESGAKDVKKSLDDADSRKWRRILNQIQRFGVVVATSVNIIRDYVIFQSISNAMLFLQGSIVALWTSTLSRGHDHAPIHAW